MDQEWVDLSISRVMHVTAKALLCRIGDVEYWIPKSQIYRADNIGRGYSGHAQVSAWWLEVNDLEYLFHEGSVETQAGELTTSIRIYRRLAAKYHPDRSPDTAETMKDINELWQAVLTDLRTKR